MTGVHRLKHVKRFFGTNLANDYSVRSHTESVLNKISDCYGTLSLKVCGSCFKGYNVLLFQLNFGSIFDCYNSFILGNIR